MPWLFIRRYGVSYQPPPPPPPPPPPEKPPPPEPLLLEGGGEDALAKDELIPDEKSLENAEKLGMPPLVE